MFYPKLKRNIVAAKVGQLAIDRHIYILSEGTRRQAGTPCVAVAVFNSSGEISTGTQLFRAHVDGSRIP